MKRFATLLIVLSLVGLFSSGPATAQEAAYSVVPDCITLSPGGQFAGNPIGTFRVIIADSKSTYPNNAVPNATVTVTFSSGADALIAWCSGQAHPSVMQTTDSNGEATFTFFGGGCVVPGQLGNQSCATPVATVVVTGEFDSFTLNIECVNSPDWISILGAPPGCSSTSNCVSGQTQVSMGDAIKHIRYIKLGLPNKCSKFVPPFESPVGLDDAVYLSPYIQLYRSCGC